MRVDIARWHGEVARHVQGVRMVRGLCTLLCQRSKRGGYRADAGTAAQGALSPFRP